MSRRDTIIIAVLVNAALLMILFATAMRSDVKKEKPMLDHLAVTPSVPPPASHDILNDYVASIPPLASSTAETLLAFSEEEILFTPPPAEVIEKPVIEPMLSEIKPKPASGELSIVSVVVKKGDFLEKIAKANNTTVAAIMKANNMSSTQLKVGQILKVPVKNEPNSTQKTENATELAAKEEYYIVKEGDSPWVIASRNKIKLEELLRLNGLDEQKAKRLRPGDKLKIR
jgi:LysM repeat protein